MVAIDDGLADACASQRSLMNKFTIVYESAKIKSSSVLNEVKKQIANEKPQAKGLVDDQLSRNQELESKYIADANKNLNSVVGEIRIFAQHLCKLEESFDQYEKFFEKWREEEESRFVELDTYISDQSESLESSQVDRLMETSDAFKGIAEELAPKFRQVIERLEELSQTTFNHDSIVSNRYKDLAAKAELSFGGQIEELLDFSDFYRGYARAYDPNREVSKVFDDVESLFHHLEMD